MINPTSNDIGRKVLYLAKWAAPGTQAEEGVLTGFKEGIAFVRYGDEEQPKGTMLDSLTFAPAPSKMVMPKKRKGQARG